MATKVSKIKETIWEMMICTTDDKYITPKISRLALIRSFTRFTTQYVHHHHDLFIHSFFNLSPSILALFECP